MKRREFIALLGGAAVAWPTAARAQQSRVPRIGVLLVDGPEPMGPYRQALRDLGYVEGKNIQIEVRSAEGKANRLSELAAEFVRSKVDVIVACQTQAATAAKNATREIPIVMAPAGDPVGTGLVASLARPGGNITGMSGTGTEMGGKNLELIREALPSVNRVAVLANANDPFTKVFLGQLQTSARMLRIEIKTHMVGGSGEFEAAFAAMVKDRAEAVIIQGSLPTHLPVDLALKYRLPALSNQKAVAKAGALMSYSGSFAERGREVAVYIDKIPKGAKPADLPVQQPSKFELTINLKTAKMLGLAIPPTLLARADEVIE